MTAATCYIVCPCGRKHLLQPGLTGPVYWCGDELRDLEGGDEVEIEDSG